MPRRVYTSDDFGAPTMTGVRADHTLHDVLDAVLVNGYGDQVITSLTLVGTTVTAVCTSPHGIQTEQCRYTISGADQAEYNGEFVITVIGGKTFTYEISGTPVSPATGTVNGRKSGGGWTIPFQSADKRMYQMVGGTGRVLHIDSSYEVANGIHMASGFDSVDSVDTGVGLFPRRSNTSPATKDDAYYWHTSSSPSNTNIGWVAVVTDEFLYLWVNTNQYSYEGLNAGSTIYSKLYSFGDYNKVISSGDYNTMITGSTTATNLSSMSDNFYGLGGTVDLSIQSRKGAIKSSPISLIKYVNGDTTFDSMGTGHNNTYPDPITKGLVTSEVLLNELITSSSSVKIGSIPGLLVPLHKAPFGHGQIINGNTDLAGRVLIVLKIYTSGATVLVDII